MQNDRVATNAHAAPDSSVSHSANATSEAALVDEVAERRRIERALAESETRFRRFAEASPDAITVVDGGRFLWANPAAAHLLGYDNSEQLLQLSFADFLLPEDLAIMGARMRRTLAGETLPPYQYPGRRRDGTMITVEISSTAIEFEGRRCVLGFGRDVTERQRLQAKLLQADRMAAVGTLAAGVAHEINNPLAYMLLHLQRLRRSLPNLIPDEAHRASTAGILDEAMEGVDRVALIVREFLSFSRSDVEELRPIDVEAVMVSTLRLASTTLRHRANIVTSYSEVAPVLGSSSRLGQVFLNLVTNAGQAFSTDDLARNEIFVRITPEANDVLVEVRDNGEGIPEPLQHRIFNPFFTTRPVGTGTGLGLAVTRAIVDSFGGTIHVTSRPGTGTTISVRLPQLTRKGSDPPT